MPPSPTDDLSTLAWVHDELRRSLEQAVKSLRRHWRELQATMPGDTEGADPAVLHQTRMQFHQGAGALAMVEQDEPARVLRAAEAALGRLAGRRLPFDEAAVTTVETAAFAVLDYLKRLIGGKAVSALALFPAYRAAQELAGADRIHPADLWPQPWSGAGDPPALPPATARHLDADTRTELERGVLSLMKGPVAPAARDLSALFAGLATTDDEPAWPLAAATFEAVAEQWLAADVYTKRLASRLLTQVRRAERAAEPAPELLRRDLLFFCARARPPADQPDAPVPACLAGVRTAHALPTPDTGDYEAARLGRFDPSLLPLARKRLATLKDAWSGWAAGESRPFAALVEHGSLVADSVHTLFPEGESLAQTLQAVMLAQGAAPQRTEAPAELAMEVATALLAIEASLDESELDRPELPDRVRRIVARLDDALAGRPPGPVEPWMEALYREASDHQTMGSVVQELHTMLGEVEQRIDRHAREPADRQVLVPVPGHLQSIRGVLSVLGLDAAASATARLREDIDRLLAEADGAPAQPLRLQGWADSLGALGFLVDMLAVQPHLAKSLFRYDPATGLLSPVMGRAAAAAAPAPTPAPALATQAGELVTAVAAPGVPDDTLVRALDDLAQQAAIAESPQMARAAATARQALGGAGDDEDARRAAREQAVAALQPFAPPPPPPVPPASPWDDDEDMREVFLDEADEVLAQAREALAVVAERPDDLDALTTLRRAFHTLKGSGRMVGLGVFAEAPWAFEQHYNRLLAQAEPLATDALQQASTAALDDMSAWITALRDTGEPGGPLTATLARAAALGTDAVPPPAPLPVAAPAIVPVHEPLPEPEPEPEPTAQALTSADVPDLPAFPDLTDTDAGVDAEARVEPPPAMPGLEALELDLAALAEPTDPPALALPDVTLGDGLDAAPPLSPDDLQLDDDEPLSDLPLPRIELADLGLPDLNLPAPAETPTAEPDAQPEPEPAFVAEELPQDEPDQYRQIGPVRVSIPLFNIFLNEADEWSRQLVTALAEWGHAPDDAPTEAMVATAHSLAGSSATVGHRELSELARALEHALDRVLQRGHGRADELPALQDAGEQVRVLLHQFAAGFLKSPTDGLIDALEAIGRTAEPTAMALPDVTESLSPPDLVDEPAPEPATEPEPLIEGEAAPTPAAEADAVPRLGEVRVLSLEDTDGAAGAAAEPPAGEGARFEGFDDLQATDALDPDLFPIFVEEAADLLPRLAQQMRAWCAAPQTPGAAQACLRTLHTLKGSARLAGAMALGEMAHRLEGGIEAAMAQDAPPDAVDALQHGADDLGVEGQRLLDLALGDPPATVPGAAAGLDLGEAPTDDMTAFVPADAATAVPADVADTAAPSDTPAVAPPAAPIDWSRFAQAPGALAGPLPTDTPVAASAPLRVRAALLERIVANAGEVSIARARLQADVSQIAGAARDLADNLERLRRQLRDIELQGEVQISTRLEAARSSSQQFDPLELDRYTRFQELTRMMAESVNDVATVQRGLLQSVQSAEDDLAGQARSARMLQDDLLRARMVEFDALSERLYRVVRQAAKDTGRQVRLDLEGTHLEIDRGVLDRLTGCFEHLLRNAIAHGIEPPAQRAAAGKEAVGHIRFAVAQEGHELAIEIRDDGAGLDLPRIRQRALEQGLLAADEAADDAALAAMIFRPGFSTAAQVTEVAGRGVGMDVVRDEVNALGGRIETATAAGRGTAFRLVVPVSTAVTQVVLLRVGDGPLVALPASVVERVHRVPSDEVSQAYARGAWAAAGQPALPFFWLGELLDEERPQRLVGRTQSVVTARSASQRVALHVEQVVGQQEAVVKPLGPQLSRLPGLMALSQLATGEVVPVYNPVALAAVYGAALSARADDTADAPAPVVPGPAAPEAVDEAPLVLVVDDSLTVRRVTQRLLAREGWRVALAKDGVDAIDRLRDERPALLLTDIEMPRMDGFDLVRHVRADRALAGLPIIMITSRIAERHREHAMSLGVNHYLGKPYAEDELVGLVQAHAPRPGT